MKTKTKTTSKVRNQILRCLLAHAENNNVVQKSTDINAEVNAELTRIAKENDPKSSEVIIHPNNFRSSCKTMHELGLINRWKEKLDWYISIKLGGIKYLQEQQNAPKEGDLVKLRLEIPSFEKPPAKTYNDALDDVAAIVSAAAKAEPTTDRMAVLILEEIENLKKGH